ncbi:DUF2637 domain-containing protein [Micromonospora aurantiaca (nom. illeg.)]|uniref:DUF2637 domain-containing protein n=1 Tax=Micromonospora aurantiaca (nom. illeg.) TaxID=47850 RepID=UPI00379D178E
MKPHPTTTRTDRIEGLVLVVILLVVAGFAGAASFTHVKDWTLDNSPPGTGAWFGWANAVISELVPVAALLTIRRRKRNRQPVGYPMFLLVAAVLLSLAAQLAVAKPGLSGWLLSAVPALAFMGLSKLVLTTTSAPAPAPARPVAPPAPAPAASRPVAPPAPAVAEPVALVDAEPSPASVPVPPARPGPVAPVPPAAFARRNGVPVFGEVTR